MRKTHGLRNEIHVLRVLKISVLLMFVVLCKSLKHDRPRFVFSIPVELCDLLLHAEGAYRADALDGFARHLVRAGLRG